MRNAEGIDAFFLERGAQVVLKPAVLQINPVARWILARWKPDIVQELSGDLSWHMPSPESHVVDAAESD